MASSILKKYSINASVTKADGTIRFVASDANPDRVGDRVFPEGIDLTNYNANPVVLWDHDARSPNIGTGKVYVENATLYLEPAFSTANPLAQQIKAQVEAGEIRAVSIGFIPLESKPNEKGGYDYTKVELTEVSLVNLPCHPGALREKAVPDDLAAAVTTALAPILEKLNALEAKIDAAMAEDATEDATEDGEEQTEVADPAADSEPSTPDEEAAKFFALFLTK